MLKVVGHTKFRFYLQSSFSYHAESRSCGSAIIKVLDCLGFPHFISHVGNGTTHGAKITSAKVPAIVLDSYGGESALALPAPSQSSCQGNRDENANTWITLILENSILLFSKRYVKT